MKFKIVARSGCGDFLPTLVFCEEVVGKVEATDENELEKKLSGKILEVEGEKCIIIQGVEPPKSIRNKKFLRWWKIADVVRVEEVEGRLFIIKTDF